MLRESFVCGWKKLFYEENFKEVSRKTFQTELFMNEPSITHTHTHIVPHTCFNSQAQKQKTFQVSIEANAVENNKFKTTETDKVQFSCLS
jgi:NACalpha-BTF3-like transcription factor